eukprot:170432-Amphidinium_carterae.3
MSASITSRGSTRLGKYNTISMASWVATKACGSVESKVTGCPGLIWFQAIRVFVRWSSTTPMGDCVINQTGLSSESAMVQHPNRFCWSECTGTLVHFMIATLVQAQPKSPGTSKSFSCGSNPAAAGLLVAAVVPCCRLTLAPRLIVCALVAALRGAPSKSLWASSASRSSTSPKFGGACQATTTCLEDCQLKESQRLSSTRWFAMASSACCAFLGKLTAKTLYVGVVTCTNLCPGTGPLLQAEKVGSGGVLAPPMSRVPSHSGCFICSAPAGTVGERS